MAKARSDTDLTVELSHSEEISIRSGYFSSVLLISGKSYSFPGIENVLNRPHWSRGGEITQVSDDCEDCRIDSHLKLGIKLDELEKNSPSHYRGMFHLRDRRRILETGKHGSYFLATKNYASEVQLSSLHIHSDEKRFYYDPFGDCPPDLMRLDNLDANTVKWQRAAFKTSGFHCHFFRDCSPSISSMKEMEGLYRVSQNGDPDVYVVKEFMRQRRKEMAEGKRVVFQHQPFYDSVGQEIIRFY